MFGIQNYWVFVLSGILVNITPGQDVMYILGRSVAQGRKAGILSVLGISTGVLVHIAVVAFGLSAVLMASTKVFHMIKYAGAAYIVYLGVRMFREGSTSVEIRNTVQESNALSIYLQGMLTDLLNPHVILFFMAFLPQFVDPMRGYGVLPFLLLGGTFATTGTAWCLIVACFAAAVSKHLRENPRTEVILRRITGSLFVLLGLRMALSKLT